MLSSSSQSEQPQVLERRRWVRYSCSVRGSHLLAYLPGSLMAEPVRNLSAGGASLVLNRGTVNEALTLELYNVRTKFVRTLPARVVDILEHPTGGFLVGLAFRWKLTPQELKHLL